MRFAVRPTLKSEPPGWSTGSLAKFVSSPGPIQETHSGGMLPSKQLDLFAAVQRETLK